MTVIPAVPAVPAAPDAARRPALRLPLRREPLRPAAALSGLVHAGVLALLVGWGGERLAPGARARDAAAGGARGGPLGVNFFLVSRAAAPVALPIPAPPAVTLSDLPLPRSVALDLPPLEPPRTLFLAGGRPAAASGTPTGGAAPGRGSGPGSGIGAGVDTGSGTAGEAGYIFGAAPRTAILPPLARVPGSVAGHTYRVHFWVAADGRVTRVTVEPPITDAGYSREFQQRMMAYQFYPAHTRDGRNVASVITVPLRIGN